MAVLTTISTTVLTAGTIYQGAAPIKTALNTATVYLNLAASITNTAGSGPLVASNLGSSLILPKIEVWYAVLPVSLGTVDKTLPYQIQQAASMFEVRFPLQGLTAFEVLAKKYQDLVPNAGGFLYTWFNCPALSQASSLSIYSAEYP